MFDLKVGFSCNNNCIHCVVGSKRDTKDLSFDDICKIIDRVPEGEEIQLTGGEISIRKDFTKIVQYCGQKGHQVVIQTNGTGLTEDIVQQIKPFVSEVLIAIHSSRPRVHNMIVRTRNNDDMFQKTIAGLDNLIKYQLPFCTQTVISKINMSSLYETFKFIQEKAPGTYMHLTYPHPLGEAWENRELVLAPLKELKQFIIPCFRDFGPFLITEAIPPCYIYPYYQNVEENLDAEIKKHSHLRQGFDPACMDNEYFTEGYTSDYNLNDLDSKRKGPKCLECLYNEECVGVWREYLENYRIHLDLFPIPYDNIGTEVQLPENCQLIDLTLKQTFRELQEILNSNSQLNPVVIHISDSSTHYQDKLNLAKALAEISEDYDFPISFLAIPKCYLVPSAKIIDDPSLEYQKLPEKCGICPYNSSCLGFSCKSPFIDTPKIWK